MDISNVWPLLDCDHGKFNLVRQAMRTIEDHVRQIVVVRRMV